MASRQTQSLSLGTASLKPSSSRRQGSIDTRRRISMEIPERLREDDEEDESETALPHEQNRPEAFVQQSMYGIIAAAHSKRNFRGTLQPLSGSESESDGDEGDVGRKGKSLDIGTRLPSGDGSSSSPAPSDSSRQKKNRMSGSIRSFLRPGRERSSPQVQDPMSHSQLLPSAGDDVEDLDRPATAIRRDAPVLDQRLQAAARIQAQRDLSAPSSARGSREGTPSGSTTLRKKPPVALAEALADIFQLDEPEDVISEYSCWYLQSVLLQGYMYVTQRHACFYAYLQKKGNVVKSGHLSKQGKRNPRYRRYWFTLKGDVLSYYASAAEPYFPSGSIDLRYAISADLAADKEADKTKEGTRFTITTDGRVFYFRADSVASAKEWVRQLQKIIFRARNDGDSVKISIPLENIVDVEANPVIESADTIKIRVIASDDTYAIDEYFFTFFANGQDALNVLDLMTADNDAKKAELEEQIAEDESSRLRKMMSGGKRMDSAERSPRLSLANAPPVPEPVRSTLSPMSAADRSSPRMSTDRGRSSGELSRSSFDRSRSSFDRGRRSLSGTRRTSYQWRRTSKSPLSPSAPDSPGHASDSQSNTTGDEPDLMSASQVLSGDGVFRGPTLRMPQPKRTVSGSTVERLRQESREQSPQSASPAPIRVQPPSRTQTDNTLTASPSEVTQSEPDYFSGGEAQKQRLQSATVQIPVSRGKRALATPLQHAYTLAGAVREQGKRMSSYLGSSPKDYYNRFSGAIGGGSRHYSSGGANPGALPPDDRVEEDEDTSVDDLEHERRFQQHFALPHTERLRAVFYCWLHRVLPLYGKIYLSDRRFCFRSLLYGTRTKLVVPFKDIQNIGKEKGFRWGYPGMVLVIRGHEELFFDFSSAELRDDCTVTVLRGLDVTKTALESVLLTDEEQREADEAALENEVLQDAKRKSRGDLNDKAAVDVDREKLGSVPILFDDPNASVLDFRPKQPLHITCLTIGSRGDVQPYIALCKGLIAQGHHAKIATHAQFEKWVRKHGVDFAPVNGDPAELMRMCVEHGMFTPSFVFETSTYARGWLEELLQTSWKACQGSDLLIESPSAMSGIHIAEALSIPYFRAFGMPWTKTRAYPHAFAVPTSKMGGQFNYMTYVIFENLFWTMTSKQINRWRRKTLRLPPTDLGKMQLNKVPFLYNFSPSVVVPPLDFSDWIRITGYWWLDEAHEWTPDQELVSFIKKTRDDGMKLVYIGFGSIPVSDTKQLTQQIVDAVLKADVRCVFSKGWSDHFDSNASDAPELPKDIFQIRSAPHDWLFKQVDAAVHHGGAGTTGASLRWGLPTVIKPFFGDQYFFATRVEDLGVGINLRKITVNSLGRAIWRACHDERMRTAARSLGEQIRQETGVDNAINAIYRDMEYAKTLIRRHGTHKSEDGVGEDDDEGEESWTFVEEESDVEIIRGTGDAVNSYASPPRPVSGSRHTSLGSFVMRGRA